MLLPLLLSWIELFQEVLSNRLSFMTQLVLAECPA
jgi:hypothetical protein